MSNLPKDYSKVSKQYPEFYQEYEKLSSDYKIKDEENKKQKETIEALMNEKEKLNQN